MKKDSINIINNIEFKSLSKKELTDLGRKLDGVNVIYKEQRWPVIDTKAEKRAERLIFYWFTLGCIFSVSLLLIFIFWPWEYKSFSSEGGKLYSLTTPLYGLTFGLAVLSIGIGLVFFQKKILPEEISIQERHDGFPSAIDRKTSEASFADIFNDFNIKRRKLISLSLGISIFLFGLGTLSTFVGGLIKNPWKPVIKTAEGKKAALWTSGWTPRFCGETIYLARSTGFPGESPFVKIRPEDLDSGGMATVFPWRESDGNGTTVESERRLTAIAMGVRNPVMLIRIRPGDLTRVIKRKGQESFNFGELFAYTKVCSHLGCPSSLYEQQTYRILCPCHQSQFDALRFARPIFGPAARALAQLPITLNTEGYLVANGDFIEPIGPAFWERKS